MKTQSSYSRLSASFFFLLFFSFQSFAQKITINAKDSDNNIELESTKKPINKGLFKRKKYTIEVVGLNNAKYKVTVDPKYTRKKTEIPTILAPLMPKTNSTEEKVPELKLSFSAFLTGGDPKTKISQIAKVTAENKATLEELAPSLKLVFDKIDENVDVLKDLKSAFETIYDKSNATIISSAETEIGFTHGDGDLKVKQQDYEQKIRDAINGFNANVALLEALVSKLTLDNFTAEFIEEYTKAKGSSQFVADNKDVFLKMAKFINKAAASTQLIEFKETEIDGDFTTIEVKVVRTNKDLTTETFVVNQKLNNRNYIKWLNITTGFFGNNLVNPEFAVSTDKTSILTEKRFKWDVSIGAMANINYVWRPAFKIGIGFGAALSPLDTKTRYLLGLTTTFGVRNEFALTGGVAWAKLQALSSSISSNGVDYDRPLQPTTVTVDKTSTNTSTTVTTQTHDVTTTSNVFSTVPTYSKWYTGFFLGVTYSFLKR